MTAILAGFLLISFVSACTYVQETVDTVAEPTTTSAGGGGMAGGGMMGISAHQMSMQMFRAMFYQGGYALETHAFEPGEYVKWQVEGRGDSEWFKKALLKRREDGKEWWRLVNKTSDSKIVMEGLLEPENDAGNRRIVRLRQQMGADQEPKEIPITKENADKWTLRRQRELTEESYAGMKVGRTEVTVPAGTFEVEHLRSSHPQRGGTVDWYLSDEAVPGSLVKYTWQSNGAKRTLSLMDYGTGETSSKLGAF